MGNIMGWIGYLMHFLLAALMILSGGMKLMGGADGMGEEMPEGLKNHLPLIAMGEIGSALLLLSGPTLAPGVLLGSAFWGGAIMAHLPKGESYLLQSSFLLVLWLAAALRRPSLVLPFVEHETQGPFVHEKNQPPAGTPPQA